VVEGVLAVLVLYRIVRRLGGPGAGVVAAAVLAVSPAVVALDRGNISDSLMILLVLLAADAVCGALVDGRWWRLVLAGVWVGLAFQAEMLEAWLVLPALALTYLVAGTGGIGRRIGQALVGGTAAAVGVVDGGGEPRARDVAALRRRQLRQLALRAGVRLQRSVGVGAASPLPRSTRCAPRSRTGSSPGADLPLRRPAHPRIAQHCRPLPDTPPPFHGFSCRPADAAAP
jgi:hypothetical protein